MPYLRNKYKSKNWRFVEAPKKLQSRGVLKSVAVSWPDQASGIPRGYLLAKLAGAGRDEGNEEFGAFPGPMNNQRGVAMMMVLTTMTILAVLVAQLIYETEVYHRIVFNNVDKLRSRYLAESALKMGLLQLTAAAKAREKAKALGEGVVSEDTIDMIWKTPIMLPPPIPPDADVFEKGTITEFINSLSLGGKFSVQISGESQKLNLNDMIWLEGIKPSETPKPDPSKPAAPTTAKTPEQTKQELEKRRTAYKQFFEQMLENRRQTDDKFAESHRNVKGEELINNLIAWMDPETQNDGENRPKEEYYKALTPPISVKNAPLTSLTELFMVKGFDDELVTMAFDSFSASLTEGVNINTISDALLRAFIPTLTDRDLTEIKERREDPGPFKDAAEFWKFLEPRGDFTEAKNQLDQKGIKFTTKETSYRVLVQATSGESTRTWVAYVGPQPPDLSPAKPTTPEVPAPPPNPDEPPKPDTPAQKADSSLVPNVLYLKAD